MIIQNENLDPSTPNDSAYGGCITYYFTQPVSIDDFGIMDIDEDMNVEITAYDSYDKEIVSFESPRTIGDNGFWAAASTADLSPLQQVMKLEMCLPGSGAISYIDFSVCGPLVL